MRRPSTTKRPRKGAPELAPDAQGVPFAEWLAGVAATAPRTHSVLADAVAKWRHDWYAPAGGPLNPLQAARLGMVVAQTLGHELTDECPMVKFVQGCVEAKLLADKGASMDSRERVLRKSRMRSLNLRNAMTYVALARGDPNWEDTGFD